MASRRQVEDEAEARRCLLAAKRKGLSAGEWAREHDIDGRSLNAWRVNLELRGASAQPRSVATGLTEIHFRRDHR